MNIVRSLLGEELIPTKECMVESPSILVNLRRERDRLARKLEDVNKAIQALEANPEINTVLELIA